MGHVYVEAILQGPKARKSVRMLLDTGATYLLIPPQLAEELGGPRLGRIPTPYADGAREELEATALILELQGRRGGAIALIRESEEPLLGVEGLEALGLKLDPSTGSLEPTRTYAARAEAPQVLSFRNIVIILTVIARREQFLHEHWRRVYLDSYSEL